ncbi:MAG: hypothetical protein GF364_04660, partial [Candidatus Lokiarchaeota archaeon]|nr:hypothetical protein [Candidatus Lokiarchaeota archaeon]
MSMRPVSLEGGPATTNALIKNRYIIFHFIMIWITALWPLWSIITHIPAYYRNAVKFVLMLPLHALAWYFEWLLVAIFVTKAFLIVVNIIHKPKEGYFPRDPKNKDYQFWCIRSVIKKFALYICHHFPLPWIDILAFKLFGVKAPWQTGLFDAWVDTEFIEIGENTIIGQGSLTMSSMITRDYLIIQKITIGDNCVIGGYSVLSPGSKVGNNVVLGTHSATSVGQELESNWVYLGVPARKYKKNEYQSDEISKDEKKRTTKKYIKQYLTIDDLEEIERKEKLMQKGDEAD